MYVLQISSQVPGIESTGVAVLGGTAWGAGAGVSTVSTGVVVVGRCVESVDGVSVGSATRLSFKSLLGRLLGDRD
jgi:hypothetical protein